MRLGWLLMLSTLMLPTGGAAQVAENSDSESTVTLGGRQDDQPEPRELPEVAEQIVAQSRAFRQQQERSAVEIDPHLTETARYFAQYMAKTNQYGHQADGQRPSQRAKAHGYDYCLVSENIGYLFSTQPLAADELARRFVEGWKESPKHRENMLEPAVTQIGAAVAQSQASGYYFAVQMLGRPQSAAIRFELTNETQTVLRYRMGEQWLELPPGYTRLHQRCQTGEVTLSAAEQAPSDETPSDETQSGETQSGEVQADEAHAAELEPLAFEPQAGDRWVVKAAAGRLQIHRRQADEPVVSPDQ